MTPQGTCPPSHTPHRRVTDSPYTLRTDMMQLPFAHTFFPNAPSGQIHIFFLVPHAGIHTSHTHFPQADPWSPPYALLTTPNSLSRSYTWMPNPVPHPPIPAGRAFALPSAMFLLAAWKCGISKLPYSLLLTASLQSPRGVANVQGNFTLTPLIYTAQDCSTAQVCPPECQDPGGSWGAVSSPR